MKTVPPLKKKKHDWSEADPDGLNVALHWDSVANPGDMDLGAATDEQTPPPDKGKVRVRVRLPLGLQDLDLGGPGSGN